LAWFFDPFAFRNLIHIILFPSTFGIYFYLGFIAFTTFGPYLLTYNLASLSGPNNARARKTQLTLSLMKQFKSNRLTLH
jgi:hypothetical protein